MRRVLTDAELRNTRRKLEELERMYSENERDVGGDEEVRELSMESLQRLINQLKEEISWTEAQRAKPGAAAQI